MSSKKPKNPVGDMASSAVNRELKNLKKDIFGNNPLKNQASTVNRQLQGLKNGLGSGGNSVVERLASEFIGNYHPPAKFHFRVDFPTINPAGFGFQEVSGMGVKWETETLEEGGLNTYSHVLLKKLSFDNLTLKRGIVGMTSPLVLWLNTFMNLGVNGIIAREVGGVLVSNVAIPMTVTLLDEHSLPSMVWSFIEAKPINWSFSNLDSMDDDSVMIEEITMAYSYFIRIL